MNGIVGTNTALPVGGTTGQVLAKASNADLDVAWGNAAAGSGDVVGPAGATASNIAVFSGATGKLIADGGAKTSDFLGVAATAADSDKLDGQHGAYYQVAGNELAALQALADTAGFVKKAGDASYSIDTSAYLTTAGTAADSDKLDGQHGAYYQVAGNELAALQALADTAGFVKKAGDASYSIDTNAYVTTAGTAAKATILANSRSIHGGAFDGSADVTNVIASTYGGTGNGFTKFTGPTTAEKTKTVRDANDTILELGGSYTPTGTWTSMTMVTPALGTPASGVLTNCSGTAASLTAGAVTGLTFTNSKTATVAGNFGVAWSKYVFGTDGGTVGTKTPGATANTTIPANAIIFGGAVNVTTACTSGGSGTLAIGTAGTGGSTTCILAATGVASLTSNAVFSAVCTTTPKKMTSSGGITFTIGTAALTAGVVEAFVFYFTAAA